jgi:hypothetical protein
LYQTGKKYASQAWSWIKDLSIKIVDGVKKGFETAVNFCTGSSGIIEEGTFSLWNFYNKEKLLQDYRNLFDNMYLSHKSRVFGFKEIRFPSDYTSLQNYINFLKELFPDIFFIFTVRDIETLSKSGWWPESISQDANVRLDIIKSQENLTEISKNNSNCLLFRYENYSHIEEIEKVFHFIGEYINHEKIKMVLSKRYNN